MKIDWLEDFIELAETGSFSSAAENRFVTHPAFGRRIKALEEWIGVPLIIRTQPVKLTTSGLMFLEVSVEVVRKFKLLKYQLKDTFLSNENILRIATGRTLASLFFPQWYKDLIDTFGFFHAHISTSGAEGSIYKLLGKETDLLIAYKTPLADLLLNSQCFDSIKIGEEVVLPVCLVGTNKKRVFEIDRSKSDRIPLLSFSHELSLKAILAKHLKEQDYDRCFKSVFEADNYDTILEMVKKGIGIAWLPYSVVKNDLQTGILQITGGLNLQFTIDIFLYKHKEESNPFLRKIWLSFDNKSD